jgi:hypothetical protein
MSNKRISQLLLEVNPKVSDLIALASEGVSKRTSLGSVLNASMPATFGSTTINGDLDVNGNLRVSQLISASILYESGSTLFGNSNDDTHTFTGSVYISGQTEFGGNLVPRESHGATLGTLDMPFAELYIQSGSLNIASDVDGDPNTTLSNEGGNILVSAGGMRLIEPGNSFIAETGSFQYISGSINHDGDYTLSGSLYISGSINDVSWIDFDTTHLTQTNVEGRLTWNDEDGTLNLGMKGGNVTLQVGQEQVVRVVNKTGSNLLEQDYKVVRVRTQAEGGAQGQRLAVVNALATNEINSATTLGIVTENIDVNQEGFVTTFGLVRGINTTGALQSETWLDGDTLYLSPTTAGGLTKNKPISPDHLVVMGYVVYAHPTQGKIFVKVDNGYELDELHNVYINESTLTGNVPTGGSSLYYSGSVWTNNENIRLTQTTAILASVSASLNFVDDTAAAAGGVPLGGLYRNGSVIQIRIV